MARLWSQLSLILTLSCYGRTQTEGTLFDNVTVMWDVEPPASLTVKKSALSSNVENAVVLTKEQEQAIVERHNVLRTIVRPSASKMRKMTWDDELARVATLYSRKCIYEHNKARSHSRFGYVGENLYISTGIPMNTALVTNAVSAWDGEKVDYDYETRKCKPGKKCGHYTQTAWDDTFKVGCGVTICRSVQVNGGTWNSATLFACNYGPGGNYDRHPFISGRSCSACDEGDTCEDNLCVNPIRDVDFNAGTAEWSEWSSWSTCSTTCLGGSAKRSRKCSTFVESDCPGYSSEITFACAPNLCNLDPLGPGAGDEDFLPWGAWGKCSVTCGNGLSVRTRRCKNRNSCSGINRLSTTCYLGRCEESGVTGVWAPWGPWGKCSVTCGDGVQKKKRTCRGVSCPGRSEDSRNCSPRQCKTSSVPEWSGWTSWTACSATCGGGSRTRVRKCSVGRSCRGSSKTRDACNTDICPAPVWSRWSSWTDCSKTCGGGSRTRVRRCLTGRNCEGSGETTDVCNTDRCPGRFSAWTEWSDCSKTCGSGIRKRTRTCVGGKDCVGPKKERDQCSTALCPVFSKWSAWGTCDVTCGSGNRVRSRTCSTSNPEDCDGQDQEAMDCTMPRCTTSGWSQWTPWSKCTVTCGGGTRTSSRICNVGNSGDPTCPGKNSRMRSCRMRKCPEYTEWSSWSACDATCGEGLKTRVRKCQYGSDCEGPSREETDCKFIDCTKSKWAPWSPWSQCTASCGEGTYTRKRVCSLGSGPPCAGDNDDTKSCKEKECEIDKPNEKDEQDDRDEPNARGVVPDGSDETQKGGDGNAAQSVQFCSAVLCAVIPVIYSYLFFSL